jgi:hypothetical protein
MLPDLFMVVAAAIRARGAVNDLSMMGARPIALASTRARSGTFRVRTCRCGLGGIRTCDKWKYHPSPHLFPCTHINITDAGRRCALVPNFINSVIQTYLQ